MLIGIIGENCSGKSTLAMEVEKTIGGTVISGKDYLRFAKSEGEALNIFKEKLQKAVDGENIIYVISEPEQLTLLPQRAIKVLVEADIDTIKGRFKKRMQGHLPIPVANMLENKHGIFDKEEVDYRFDGVSGDATSLCESLKSHRS